MNKIITKLAPFLNKLLPVLEKRIPFFAQTIRQFGKSKSNITSIIMLISGLCMLYNDLDSSLGVQLFTYGIGLITLKDAVVKKNTRPVK